MQTNKPNIKAVVGRVALGFQVSPRGTLDQKFSASFTITGLLESTDEDRDGFSASMLGQVSRKSFSSTPF